MKTVSKEFRQKMYGGARFYQEAKILFADGREKELGKKDFYISGNAYSDGPGTNAFPLGEAMAKHITMSLVNDDDSFSDYDFYMAKITVWLKCDLSETTESILLGTYTVTTPETYGASVMVEALDDMYKGDEEYNTEIIFPATIGTILRDSCLKVGVSLLSTTFSNDSFEIQEKPENITHRQLWGMIAMLAGGNARMDENNYLEIVEYDFSYFEKKELDGGYFDANIPYESGDEADGGNFTDWNSGDSFDGGDFAELDNFHFFYKAKTPTIATDDVVITGIQTIVDETEYLFGNEGYVIKIENQLINDNPENAVKLIGSKIVGLQFRPFTIDHIAYPLAEFGDICYVADRKGNVYQSVVTDVNFTYFGYTTISCAADDPLRNSSKYYSSEAETIRKARQYTKKYITAYDLAVQQLTSLMTQSFGVFKTEEKQEDGSIIYYMHNKPALSDSSTIWKMTSDAFAVSTDGGETWNAGMDAEGNAVVNVLNAIGINADWIVAGLITDALGMNKWDLGTGELTITGGNINLKNKTTLQTMLRVAYNEFESTIYAGSISTQSSTGGVSLYSDGFMFINANGGTGGNVIYIADHRCEIGSTYTKINGNYAHVSGNFIVDGTKSRLASTENYSSRLLYCYETPSPMFGDLGEGQIDETGKCYIFLDDIFGETIDADCTYQVFLQPYGKGECYVTERTASYFVVEGTNNLAFGWELKAIQRDFDTIRLEEYQKQETQGADVTVETYNYLTTLLYNPETEEIENE